MGAGRQVRTLQAHSLGVISVAISADGKRVVSASASAVMIWDEEMDTEVRGLCDGGGAFKG